MEKSKQDEWLKLKEVIQNCNKCNLSKHKNNPIICKNSLDSKIMIINDFSYNEDDKTGEPFSSGMGQLVKKCLQGNGINEKEVYFTNILKCKKDYTDNNIQQSIQNCMNYLRYEVSIIRPQIIVLLGNNVIKNILGQEYDVKKSRGEWIEKKGVYFMPTWNPIDIIREENKKIEMWLDFKKIKERLYHE